MYCNEMKEMVLEQKFLKTELISSVRAQCWYCT